MWPTTPHILNPTVICPWCSNTVRRGDPDHGITHSVCSPCTAKVQGTCRHCGDTGRTGERCMDCGCGEYANLTHELARR